MRVVGFLVVLAYVTSATALLFVGSRFGSFDGIDSRTDRGYSFLENLGSALYVAPFSMMMENVAPPRDGLGKLVAFLVGVQGGSLLLFALTAALALPNLMPSAVSEANRVPRGDTLPVGRSKLPVPENDELNESCRRIQNHDLKRWLVAAAVAGALVLLLERRRRRELNDARNRSNDLP
jgi:hypothetical protein